MLDVRPVCRDTTSDAVSPGVGLTYTGLVANDVFFICTIEKKQEVITTVENGGRGDA